MTMKLNKKEDAVFKALKKFYRTYGKMPTVRELMLGIREFGVNFKSSRSISVYLEKLEVKKLIRRNPVTRKLEILDGFKKAFVDIPIYGGANCGVANIFADEYLQGTLKVAKNILKNKIEDVFAVQVSGDSMNRYELNGKNIEEDDYVLVDSSYKPTQEDKDVPVLAVIDGLATVKALWHLGDKIGLFPKSSKKEFRQIYLTSQDDFIINGKVIEILKTA
jgi:SOS-response transcriptional repressor LexA